MSIKVDTDALVRAATDLNSYRANIIDCFYQAKQTVSDTQRIWDSSGGDRFYVDQMRFLTDASDVCDQLLLSHIDFLNAVAEVGYCATEREIKKKASQFI